MGPGDAGHARSATHCEYHVILLGASIGRVDSKVHLDDVHTVIPEIKMSHKLNVSAKLHIRSTNAHYGGSCPGVKPITGQKSMSLLDIDGGSPGR